MFTDRCSSHCFSMYERMKTNLPKEVMAMVIGQMMKYIAKSQAGA